MTRSLCLTIALLLSVFSALAFADVSPFQVEYEMRELIRWANSPAYAAAATQDEYVVRCFELAKGRAPSVTEFYTAREALAEAGVPRDALLASLLAPGDGADSWKVCSDFVETVRKSDFLPTADTRRIAAELAAMSGPALKSALVEESRVFNEKAAVVGTEEKVIEYTPDETYNVYFGYLHAHSRLSDGTGEPEQAYEDARTKGRMDYFALTDHGELLSIWPWENKWEQLKSAARAADRPGEYAALWGFEWSSPIYGHFNVINSDDMTSVFGAFFVPNLYDWMHARPECFGIFNHPGRIIITMGDEHDNYRVNPAGMERMVGIDLWHSGGTFTRYFYQTNYLELPNRNGWHIAPLGCEDNHDADWGQRGQKRTAVLAKELTREAIVEAHKARRFYATEDDGIILDFRCNGYPMGARLAGDTSRVFHVTATDRGGDLFEEVRLYRDAQLLQTRAVEAAEVDVTFADLEQGQYYYVVVRQRDDNDLDGRNDEAISAPIWFDSETPTPAAPGCAGGVISPAPRNGTRLLLVVLAAALWFASRVRVRSMGRA